MRDEDFLQHVRQMHEHMMHVEHAFERMLPKKREMERVFKQLNVGSTSGSLPIECQFVADYIGVMNNSGATLYIADGQVGQQPPDSLVVLPGVYLSLPLTRTGQQFTVFWSSQAAITATNNITQFMFSNQPFSISGGTLGN